MAFAKIGTYYVDEKNLVLTDAQINYSNFFFNNIDIIELLNQPNAGGVVIKNANFKTEDPKNPECNCLVMVAVYNRNKNSGYESELRHSKENIIAFACPNVRDYTGGKRKMNDIIELLKKNK